MLGFHLRGRLFGFNKSDSGRFRHQPTLSRETAGCVDEGHKRNMGVYDVNGDNCDIFLEREENLLATRPPGSQPAQVSL
jgi:hypothetical protein